jgi:hypothetical protein
MSDMINKEMTLQAKVLMAPEIECEGIVKVPIAYIRQVDDMPCGTLIGLRIPTKVYDPVSGRYEHGHVKRSILVQTPYSKVTSRWHKWQHKMEDEEACATCGCDQREADQMYNWYDGAIICDKCAEHTVSE